jgi:hypothetical protein
VDPPMPALIDLLYREYCRARLTEMRKQLLVSPGSNNAEKESEVLHGVEEDSSDLPPDQQERAC